jgi:hypothetical protein
MFCQTSVRRRLLELSRNNRLFSTALAMTLAWSVFALLWEPAGYYWSVILVPGAVLALLWVREYHPAIRRPFARWMTAGILLVASGWNLYADRIQDKAFSVSYPPPFLEQIQRKLGPHDIFIVAGREWYNNLDYDLLLECLNHWPRNPARALIDDYVVPDGRGQWEEKLAPQVQAVLQSGGRVFVAEHIFWKTSYDDLEQSADAFSEYTREEYSGVNTINLADEVGNFFREIQAGRVRVQDRGR